MAAAPHTAATDALVELIWRTPTLKGRREVMEKHMGTLERLGITRSMGYKRAREQGWLRPLKTHGREWSKPELAILEASAHCSPSTVRARLRAKGFQRSETAVLKQRLARIGSRYDARWSSGNYSTGQAGLLIGVNSALICSYIKRGMLAATREEQHWIITADALRRFIREYPAYVNLDKVDKYAFLDLVCGSMTPRQAPQALDEAA